MIRKINTAYRKMRDSKSKEDTNVFYDLKRTVQREIRTSYNSYMGNIINPDLAKGNIKLWGMVKRLKSKRHIQLLPTESE